MSERIPDLDSVHPKWRNTLDALKWAEHRVAVLERGTPERRAASRHAGKLAKEWRRMHADVAAARRAAGWVMSSPLSWVKLIHRDPEVMFDCECGGNVRQTRRPGRRYQLRTDVFLPVPETFSIPTCDRCDEQYFTVERAEALDAAALAMAYEAGIALEPSHSVIPVTSSVLSALDALGVPHAPVPRQMFTVEGAGCDGCGCSCINEPCACNCRCCLGSTAPAERSLIHEPKEKM